MADDKLPGDFRLALSFSGSFDWKPERYYIGHTLLFFFENDESDDLTLEIRRLVGIAWIDWGDGSPQEHFEGKGSPSHTYAPGSYRVEIGGNIDELYIQDRHATLPTLDQ